MVFFGNLITAIGEELFNFSCARPELSSTSVVCPAGHRCHTYAVYVTECLTALDFSDETLFSLREHDLYFMDYTWEVGRG
jgi:hypothetical protein